MWGRRSHFRRFWCPNRGYRVCSRGSSETSFSPGNGTDIYRLGNRGCIWSQAFFKNTTPYAISAHSPDLATLIPILIIAGPVVAATAITFMQGLRYSAKFARESGWSAERLIVTAATICGTVGIWVPEILGVGLGTVNAMLDGQYQIPMLLVLLVLKISMTAVCIGFGLFGGVFSPALFIGVAVGGLVAQISIAAGVQGLTEAISIAAMASVAATVIGAPITAVLIVLELTQSYAYAVAALMAVMTSMLLTHDYLAIPFLIVN